MSDNTLKFTDQATNEPILVRRLGTELVSAEPANGGTRLKLDIKGEPALYNVKETTGDCLKILEGRAATASGTKDLGTVAAPGEALDIEQILKTPG